MNKISTAEYKKERIISPIWLLPILAVLLGGWLLFKAWSEAGIKIDIVFESAQGITTGQTQVFYQGLDIGVVKSVKLGPKLQGVVVKVEIKREAESLLTSDAQFWLVRPKASITEISGLDALVSGNYIELNPGTGELAEQFVALNEPPNIVRGEGLNLKLSAADLGSLNIGSGIYYKKIKVGDVQRFQLKNDLQVEFDILIKPQFAHLVKTNSHFWNVSGFKADISLDGMQISSEGLASVITGGISFDSPPDSPVAVKGHQFKLFNNLQEAHRGKVIEITMAKQYGLIAQRSKLLYRGAVVGFITEINTNSSQDDFVAKALVEPKYEGLFNQSTQLVLIKPNISLKGFKNIDALIGAKQIEVYSDPSPQELQNSFRLSQTVKPPLGSKSLRLLSDNVRDLTIGSPVIYQGLSIGQLSNIRLVKRHFEIDAFIEPDYVSLVSKNSRFYLQSPLALRADINGISVESSGLSGFLNTPIVLMPGTSTTASTQKQFTLYPNQQAAKLSKEKSQPALKLRLMTEELGSLGEGSPVLYHKLPIGKVSHYQLAANGELQIDLIIEGQYRHLITNHSRFWHASGIEIQASLDGLSVNSESLKSLMIGGISVDQFDQLAKETQRIVHKDKQSATKRQLTIKLHSQDAQGLRRHMPIKYQGQQIGRIVDLSFDDSLSGLTATAELDYPYYRNFARTGSLYWQESAQLSLSSVKNLDTLVKGDFISALPGKGQPRLEFSLHKQQPNTDRKALIVWLSASHFGSLKVGSPVLYKQYQVGKVDAAKLSLDGSKIMARLKINSKYRHLVRANSLFWNASGIDVKLGLSGADIRVDSMETLLSGGIAFATPDKLPLAKAAANEDKFELQSTYDEKWLQWSPSIQP
ncbi:MlaD family protein [Agarivorans sp. QJM3NY_29]|uniref:PqiB family protein n=1 Tax=unclassified Agarivorans TaxID=2636026 RepID=UPI003D7D3B4D